jgi:hypothetical protein|tara:strand:+ start:606 stop:977 length:372 start_codon:yes stop_codon:yes gene_type:complete
MTWGQLVMNIAGLLRLLKHALNLMTKDYIFDDFRIVMIDALVDAAHHEVVAYAGMILILTAFFLETRDILDSKASVYLQLMALGSGLLAIRAYLIDEWAFFILEIAWFSAALLGLMSLSKLND